MLLLPDCGDVESFWHVRDSPVRCHGRQTKLLDLGNVLSDGDG